MKRLLPFIPIFILLFLNACGNLPIPDNVGTAVAKTQTAAVWTQAPTQTPNPNIPGFIEWLNAELSNTDPLEQSLDAKYRVTNVSFPLVAENSTFIFRVEVRCECATRTKCCVPERTFVVVLTSMKKNTSKVLGLVPLGTSEMRVECSDHEAPIGVMSALWPDVRDYLYGNISGYQLGGRVFNITNP